MRRSIHERNILFLCRDNASLSQIAEAMAKHLSPPKIKIFSAGVKPKTIPPQVYRVMQELGISMSGQAPKSVDQVPLDQIDLVVSFDEADKECAILPKNARVKRWSVPEPAATQNGDTSLPMLRRERDEIDKQVSALFLDYWRNIV
jgi:protein-tyrosine-phosphatase